MTNRTYISPTETLKFLEANGGQAAVVNSLRSAFVEETGVDDVIVSFAAPRRATGVGGVGAHFGVAGTVDVASAQQAIDASEKIAGLLPSNMVAKVAHRL